MSRDEEIGAIVAASVIAMKASEEKPERFPKLTAWKPVADFAKAAAWVVALIVGATITVSELKAKPSFDDVNGIVETRTEIYVQKMAEIETLKTKQTKADAERQRMRQVQDLELEMLTHHGNVLRCLARRCKKPPTEPKAIEDKRKALMK